MSGNFISGSDKVPGLGREHKSIKRFTIEGASVYAHCTTDKYGIQNLTQQFGKKVQLFSVAHRIFHDFLLQKYKFKIKISENRLRFEARMTSKRSLFSLIFLF